VQPVAGPQLVPHGGFEATVDLPLRAAVRADVQPLPRQVRLQRPQPRHLLHAAGGGGEHDLSDLRRGPLRPLPLQLERELQHPGRRARHHNPRRRDERVEPAQAIRANPPIQRAARNPNQPAVRPDMLPAGERPDQPAALRLREPLVSRIPNQRIPKQADLPATILIHVTFSSRSRSIRARDLLTSQHALQEGDSCC
jgi:hypothetical protein